MAAADDNSTVILATARAQVDAVLSAFKGASERATGKVAAAYIATTIEPLERAVAALSQAVAASVGYSVQTPGPKAK